MTINHLEKMLDKPDMMKDFREFLKVENEMPEETLSDTIDAHIYVLAEIDMVNKKKIEAVDNEDFELAAKYK
jgi:hypothetical protein